MSKSVLLVLCVLLSVFFIPSVVGCNGDPNAVSGCGVNCGRHCSNYDSKEPVFCTKICYENGCDCKKGYVFDDNTNKCVKPKDCSPVCGSNEEYSSCIEGGCFDARNCSEISDGQTPAVKCVKPAKCTEGCLCREGYLRNSKGICVARKDCPPKAQNRCTKANEVYDECPAQCPPRECGVDITLIDCAPQPSLGDPNCPPPACRCADGFYRNDKEECVEWENCPTCNGVNEEWNNCPVTCPPNTCEQLWIKYNCLVQPQVCKPACTCKSGFYRNKIGVCISANDCLKCTGQNEYYSCGGACDNVCATLSEQSQDNCPIVNIKCNEMCYCQKGYARLSNGTCVPFDQCP